MSFRVSVYDLGRKWRDRRVHRQGGLAEDTLLGFVKSMFDANRRGFVAVVADEALTEKRPKGKLIWARRETGQRQS